MRVRALLTAVAVLSMLTVAGPAQAIRYGEPDRGAHPYVGQLTFYWPTTTFEGLDEAGFWAICTGTLVSPTVVVTAGHCTYDIGRDGAPSETDKNDVWVSFAEEPDDSTLEPASTFADDPSGSGEWYASWSASLDASAEWIRGTAYTHPEYDPVLPWLHDLAVIVLDQPVVLDQYGVLPTEGLLDQLHAADRQQRYTDVGYGWEGAGPRSFFGGGTRRRADLRLVTLRGTLGAGGLNAGFSNNARTGGMCHGDSGGPIFVAGTVTMVAVNSFVLSPACTGSTGAYRLDQADALDFLATFDLRP